MDIGFTACDAIEYVEVSVAQAFKLMLYHRIMLGGVISYGFVWLDFEWIIGAKIGRLCKQKSVRQDFFPLGFPFWKRRRASCPSLSARRQDDEEYPSYYPMQTLPCNGTLLPQPLSSSQS